MEEIIKECIVPAICGVIGSFIGMAIAYWTGIL